MSAREFTFPDYERLTPDLTPSQRLAVFLALPQPLQDEAWNELGERIERRTRALFAEDRLGGVGTAREVAAEIAALWPEVATVPLGGVTAPAPSPSQPARARAPSPSEGDSGLDVLRSIPSAEYVPALTGRDVVRGFVQCPFHGGGDERSPSLHVSDEDGRWHCFACDAGGGLLDFAAALDGRSVPTGREFIEFVREIASALAGGRSWR